MRTSVAFTGGVERDDLAHHLIAASGEHSYLRCSQRISHHHKAVAAKQRHSALDFARSQDLQPLDAVVGIQVFAKFPHLAGVVRLVRPGLGAVHPAFLIRLRVE